MGSGVRAAAYVSDFRGGGLPLTAPLDRVRGGCASVRVGGCAWACVRASLAAATSPTLPRPAAL